MFSNETKKKHRGGKREGAGRKSEGKAPFTVTLTKAAVTKARKQEKNFSGLLDRLLTDWLFAA